MVQCCLRRSDLKRQNKKNLQKTKQNTHYGYIFKYQAFSPTYLVAKILPDALPSYARYSITSRREAEREHMAASSMDPNVPRKPGQAALSCCLKAQLSPCHCWPAGTRDKAARCENEIQYVRYLTAPGILQGEREAGWRKRDLLP